MIIERILDLLNEKGLTMADLSRHLNVGSSTVTNWKTRNTDPPAKMIPHICEFLEVSADYLLTGKEKNVSLSAADKEWLTLIHELPKDMQIEFRGELKGYIKAYHKKISETYEVKQAK